MPANPRFGDVYRSKGEQGDAGLVQARHVFLRGCSLLAEGKHAAWADAPSWQVLETGFGLGLNFLATWHAWRADPARPKRLFYSAVEAWPPEANDILRSAAPFNELMPLAQELASQWRGLLPGVHRLEFEGGRLQLTLAVGEVQPMLAELTGQFDSIYIDGFSPALNPDMWSLHTLKAVARLARRGACAASWCVAGEVRERLITCGFSVERVPGLPPKRHALRAKFEPRWQPRLRAQALAIPLPTIDSPLRCTVIGGGLAGASCAYSLAQRGWQVTVLDRAPEPAAGASGLPAGVVAPHVSPDDRPLSRLSRAGARATLKRVQLLAREGVDFALTGVLERHAPGERRLPTPWLDANNSKVSRATTHAAGDRLTLEKAQQASVPLNDTQLALWHDHAGWIKPAALVRTMLASSGITWRGSQAADRLESANAGVWRVLDSAGAVLTESELVVIAAGFDTRALLCDPGKPLPSPCMHCAGK
ncbi:tRNA (5-methylaminomethyl-2-thiouridine)(34)-methyltransferase MnmD [Ottowia caeni]|uniref:tRNA (5-methylaminomethyl-2-thiouridine)(34)-methyltransferase MnmD n=1 Tax=Ottowia caeni TaxID=2870339 RepID=UPI003D731B2F